MPRIETAVNHSLGAEEAKRRLDDLMTLIRRDYSDMVSDLKGGWEGETLNVSFRAYGFNISSNVNVEPNRVAVRGEIPFAAIAFKGKIQQTIVSKLEEILA